MNLREANATHRLADVPVFTLTARSETLSAVIPPALSAFGEGRSNRDEPACFPDEGRTADRESAFH